MVERNLKDKAYNYIKERIIRCEFLPGQFLVEAELIRAIDASRTPIREALNKLEQDRLITILPKRGILVNDITLADINAIYEVRFLVEPPVVRKYGHLISDAKLEEMLLKNNASAALEHDLNEYDLDSELHNLFIETCGNTYLMELMQRIFAQNHRVRILSGERLEYRLQATVREHEAILEELLKKDYTAAEEAMRIHLEHSREAAVTLMTTDVRSWGRAAGNG
ncbi:MAG: GntR family transcriptional regulator [Acidaminococcaceae bacterium]|nr:GntR family transcriptional regulator [Acidaminococcaceae bacterium]